MVKYIYVFVLFFIYVYNESNGSSTTKKQFSK